MKWNLTLVLVIGLVQWSFSQPDFRLGYSGKLDVGANFAKFDDRKDLDVTQKIGSAIDASAGIGFRYKEKYGLFGSGGGVIDTYNFNVDTGEYSISSLTWKLQLTAFVLIPIKKNKQSDLHIGLEAGRIFYGQASEGEQLGEYSILTSAYGPPSNYIAPELGLVKTLPRGAIHMGVTYSHIIRDSAAVNIAFTKESTTAFAKSKGDYLGLRIRFVGDITPPNPPKLKLPEPPVELNDFMARENRVGKTYSLKRRVVRLRLWDHGELDGDTISVFYNDHFILVDHPLTRKKKILKLYLHNGTNTLMICAKNEGRISPNTVACRIIVGGKEEDFIMSTSMDRNETLLLNLD